MGKDVQKNFAVAPESAPDLLEMPDTSRTMAYVRAGGLIEAERLKATQPGGH
jgi:hypothetical protein